MPSPTTATPPTTGSITGVMPPIALNILEAIELNPDVSDSTSEDMPEAPSAIITFIFNPSFPNQYLSSIVICNTDDITYPITQQTPAEKKPKIINVKQKLKMFKIKTP